MQIALKLSWINQKLTPPNSKEILNENTKISLMN